MKCTDMQSKIFDYIDCELDKNHKAKVAEHLLECLDCRTKYDAWQAFVKDIQSTKDEVYMAEQAGTSIKAGVMNAVEKFETEKRKYKTSINKWNKLIVVAASFAILFTGISTYNNFEYQASLDNYSQEELTTVKKQDMVTISSADPIITDKIIEKPNNNINNSLAIFSILATGTLFLRNRQTKKKLNILLEE